MTVQTPGRLAQITRWRTRRHRPLPPSSFMGFCPFISWVCIMKLLIPISSVSLRLNRVIYQIAKTDDTLKSLSLHNFALHGYKVRFVSSIYLLCVYCNIYCRDKTELAHQITPPRNNSSPRERTGWSRWRSDVDAWLFVREWLRLGPLVLQMV